MQIQIDDEVRDATAEEVAAYQEQSDAAQAATAAATAARDSARAKLAALGLTVDDLTALGL